MNERPVLLLGAGGHAQVILAMLKDKGYQIVGVSAPELKSESYWNGIRVIGDDNDVLAFAPQKVILANGVGVVAGGKLRSIVHARFMDNNYDFVSLMHSSAVVDASVELAAGVQIMAGAVVQPKCRIDAGVVVNTGAIIDHDCWLSSRSFIGPGVTLCGGVCIEEDVFVGAGAVVLPGINIGKRAVVGAGAVVTRSVKCDAMVVGNPAKCMSGI